MPTDGSAERHESGQCRRESVAMFHVIVMPLVSAALGRFLRGEREPLRVVLNRLYDQLESHADRYKNRRDPEDPDLFDYDLNLFDGEKWQTLRFSVDDRQATGYLFVVGFAHELGKSRR
jgi:hypothetical protein